MLTRVYFVVLPLLHLQGCATSATSAHTKVTSCARSGTYEFLEFSFLVVIQ
jgi:hypothetical protein